MLATLLVIASSLLAFQDPAAPVASAQPEQSDPLAALKFESSAITIGTGLAQLELPPDATWLAPKDARFVLEKYWHNPPRPDVLGMIVPGGKDALEQDGWAVIVSYDSDGHVKDEDAKDIDFADLLHEMKTDTTEANPAREKAGFESVELRGWAEPPHYDALTKKLYWAKDLVFAGAAEETLNYDVRILGRTGVLVYSAVASMPDLPVVAAGMKQYLSATSFTEGKRYSDFNPSLDKVAAYGIGALIAGKVIVKTGLIALLLSKIKIVIVALGAAAATMARFFKKLFRRGTPTSPAT